MVASKGPESGALTRQRSGRPPVTPKETRTRKNKRLELAPDFPSLSTAPHAVAQEYSTTGVPRSPSENLESTVSEPEDDPEKTAAIEKEYMETMDLELCLDEHRMYLDRYTEMPPALGMLKSLMLEPRQAPLSPLSKHIARANLYTRGYSDMDAMTILEDFLGYTPQDSLHVGRERGVIRGHNQQWNATSMPIPATEHDKTLAAAIKAVGSPANPKPDIAYGYPYDVFFHNEISRARGCSSVSRVTDNEPLWPFYIMEWKSNLGQMNNCRLHAMQDGAAAVNSLWHLLHETGTAQPQEHETAAFCACVGPETISIYICWRRDHPTEGLSWEMDLICNALLNHERGVFHIRSVLLNILKWARITRLDCIKAALRRRPSKRTFISFKAEQDPKSAEASKTKQIRYEERT
ncbi:hypothetical protein MMC19_005267 [Ptychographa xylographoides]|nr:hypothetical protein [Ptychographa xylographoides]